MRTSICVAGLALMAAGSLGAQQKEITEADWSNIETALGRPGAMQPGGIIKFSFPRSDLTVTAGGVTLKPALALGSWVAFKRTADGKSLAMGDLVLLDAEVGAVMKALQAGGVEQTALHNHILNETPHVMYMHIMGHGDADKVAKTIHDALAVSKTPLAAPGPAAAASAADLDTTGIAAALKVAGKLNGAVYQVSVPRAEKIIEMGEEIPPSMGMATAINFQPTGGGKAAITGDFVMVGSEVNKVIRALIAHGITPTGLHRDRKSVCRG